MSVKKSGGGSDHLKKLNALIRLSGLINSSLDIAAVRRKAIEAVAEVTDSEAGSLLFVDENTGELYFDVAFGAKGKEVKGTRIRKGQGIAGWVAAERRPVIVNDVKKNPCFFKGSDEKSGFVTRNMICAPVMVKGRLLGVLQAINKKDASYSREDLDLLVTLSNQVAVAVDNATLYQELRETFLETVDSFAEAVDKKDSYTGGHTRRVMNYCLLVGRALGMPEKDQLALKFAAILHDIGKIGIKDSILLKKGRLTAPEFALFTRHVVFGAEILGHIRQLKDVVPGVKHHHEKYDGSGYPDRLSGGDIPLIAQIIAVADAFDAITTDRPYQKAVSIKTGFEILRNGAGSQFAPEVVDAFIRAYRAAGARRSLKQKKASRKALKH